jgi:hypothetical protein
MYKVLWFLKRKPGITHEQFRDHYESSHAVLAQKYLGHLFLGYRRNYPTEVWGGGAIADGGAGFGRREWSHDCVAEWILPDESSFEQVMALFSDPVIGRIFYEDEEHFLDRDSILLLKCDSRDTGVDLETLNPPS